MSDYTTNYMSNTARMIGFSTALTRIYIDELKHLIDDSKLSKVDRTRLLHCITVMEKNKAVVELWWQKRGEENVTVESLEAEINNRYIAQLEPQLERA